MPACGRCRRSWAPWGCKFGSVRALCIGGKEIKGSEGMNRLVPDLERIPCLQWQEKGMLWLWSLSVPADVSHGGICAGCDRGDEWQNAGQLSASFAGKEQKFHLLKSPKQPSSPQDCPELILIWILSDSKLTPPPLMQHFAVVENQIFPWEIDLVIKYKYCFKNALDFEHHFF